MNTKEQHDWSHYMIQADQLNREITELLNHRQYEEADRLLRENINLLSQTRGWILSQGSRKWNA